MLFSCSGMDGRARTAWLLGSFLSADRPAFCFALAHGFGGRNRVAGCGTLLVSSTASGSQGSCWGTLGCVRLAPFQNMRFHAAIVCVYHEQVQPNGSGVVVCVLVDCPF